MATPLNFRYFSRYGISIDQNTSMDKNVEKRYHLPTLLSMNARQKAIKLFKENHGLLRTAEAIRLGIHPRIITSQISGKREV